MFVLFLLFAIASAVGFFIWKSASTALKGAGRGVDTREVEQTKNFAFWLMVSTGLLGVIFLLSSLFYVVKPGYVGVEVCLGKVVRFTENGFRVKNPISSVVRFDTRVQKLEFEADSASMDMQTVKIQTAINYRLDFAKIKELYLNVGADFEEKVIKPTVLESIKAGSSKFPVEKIIGQRIELRDAIFSILQERLAKYYIILEGISLQNIAFDPEFTKVVEQKMMEEQKIKTAEYIKKQAEQQRDATILTAQGEAEKQRLLRATTSPEVIQLKYLEKWNGVLPTIMSGSGSGLMLNMNMNK